MSFLLILIYIFCGLYMLLNFKFDIQMFQQNSYRISRYWRWLNQDNFFNSDRLVDLACVFIPLSTLLDYRAASIIVTLTGIVMSVIILKRKYKKPLVFTPRVKRLYGVTALLALLTYVPVCIFTNPHDTMLNSYTSVGLTVAIPFAVSTISWAYLILAAWIMKPVEKMIQNRYINDAKRILKQMPDLKIIGITGSFGKTSTKYYLERILAEKYDVLITPGSFNTPMGVVRTVREYLKPYNEVFICEMGAKQKGDIKEICDIVHPHYGIITAVGPMHLESFLTIENVQATKFELADALGPDGYVAVNQDFEYCANRQVTNTRDLRYGIQNTRQCDYIASDIVYSPAGTTFRVEGPHGFSINLKTRLLGEANISDILGALVIARQLNISDRELQKSIAELEPVEHRLSMKRTPGGVTIIDDAFNSNPVGSKMAVEVLGHFKNGKRIIVTPGMIELGSQQYELNKELGSNIAQNVDIAIIVGQYNRKSISEGLAEANFPEDNIHIVDSFNEAQSVLSSIMQSGDTVLYENDLPDTFK